eukprot:gnl/MRDRNA2_/MRDRNA2_90827_c0_seq1.p1 gnl/MRDRNA2_/MRDRNA2_90827_c0~~gnl/MRDRNA2_/MRDRNA2_90827_c0_seq1.p1  ORF type:complete len:1092 (+),score=347.69 gnl/MRDRNA2_/MRDRNA2_90827_c0_seq1:98-3277(+)
MVAEEETKTVEEGQEAEDAKKEEDVEMKEEEKKEAEPEKPKEEPEKEEDAPADSRPKLKIPVVANDLDATLDCLVSGNVLTALCADGFQYLVSGTRANVGIKQGRYFFEVRVLESHIPSEVSGRGRGPMPKQFVRIGFSTASSSLFLGDGPDNVCFESEGNYVHDGKRIPCKERFGREDVVACLLNLDASTPNANTVSFFRNGRRVSFPQPLPEHLVGKALYPHVSFKNASVIVNYSEAWQELPFKCRTVQDAAEKDTEMTPVTRPKDGKYEAIFPVGLPDEGVFDWVDQYLEKNPSFTELSDRKIMEWCEKSGLRKIPAQGGSNSNDRPLFSYGLPQVDDLSVRKVIKFLAATLKRNVVVLELKSNLVKSERAELLQCFASPVFKKKAFVVAGEPNAEFMMKIREKMLEDKKKEGENKRKLEEVRLKGEQMKKIGDLQRKRAMEKREKEAEKAKEEAEKARMAAAKAAEEAAAKAEGGEGEAKEEEKKEEVKDEKKDEDVKMEDEVDEEMEELKKPIEVEMDSEYLALNAEEKKRKFRPNAIPDCAPVSLGNFGEFCFPEKTEGFDDVSFAWSQKTGASKRLKEWIAERKITERVEDLRPSDWFKEKKTTWEKEKQELQAKIGKFKAAKIAEERKKNEEARKAEMEAKKAEEEAKKAEEEAKKLEAAKKAEEEGTKEGEEEKKAEEEKKEEEKEEEAPAAEKPAEVVAMDLDKEPEVDTDGVDVWDCDDVDAAGEDGEPLYMKFEQEDWALVNLKYEMHLLAHAYLKDINDEERPGIYVDNIGFYYSKYFNRQFATGVYGCPNVEELMKYLKHVVSINDKKVLVPLLSVESEAPMFVKLTEEERRTRKRKLNSGDESVRLKFQLHSDSGGRRGKDGKGDRRDRDRKGGGKNFGKFGEPQGPGANMNGPNMANMMGMLGKAMGKDGKGMGGMQMGKGAMNPMMGAQSMGSPMLNPVKGGVSQGHPQAPMNQMGGGFGGQQQQWGQKRSWDDQGGKDGGKGGGGWGGGGGGGGGSIGWVIGISSSSSSETSNISRPKSDLSYVLYSIALQEIKSIIMSPN